MAPVRGASSKSSSKQPKARANLKSSQKSRSKPKLPPPSQQKTRRPEVTKSRPSKKRPRDYTDTELSLPTLNMITPAGVQKPKGKKKGKVFVDDSESMMTILAMVNADKEGQIESKTIKARQMEEIREARRKEAEKRGEAKRGKLEEKKDEMRRQKKRKEGKGQDADVQDAIGSDKREQKPAVKKLKKKVSFA